MPASDAALIAAYCNIELSERQVQVICSRCRPTANMPCQDSLVETVITSPLNKPKTESARQMNKTTIPYNEDCESKNEISEISQTRSSEVFPMVGAVDGDSEELQHIDVENFICQLLAVCRRQLLTSILAERRGFLNMSKLQNYGTIQGSIVTTIVSAGSVASRLVDSCGTELIRSKSAGENSTASDQALPMSTRSVPASMVDSMDDQRFGEQSMASVGANDEFPDAEQLRWDKDPGEVEMTLDESSTAFYSHSSKPGAVGSVASHNLPPLKLQLAKQKDDRKKILRRAGYDTGFSRPTPRCLIGNGLSQPVKTKSADQALDPMDQIRSMQGVISTVEALRLELQIAQAGLAQLDNTMDEEIVWVAKHCSEATQSLFNRTNKSVDSNVSFGGGPTLSNRSKNRCRQIALTNFCASWQGFMQTTLQWSMQRWRRSVQFEKLENIIDVYSKAKAIEMLSDVYSEAMSRQLLKPWKTWLRKIQTQVMLERSAAVVEMQRIVRSKLGRNRLKRLQLMRLVTCIQCMFRRHKARRILAHRRARALRRKRAWAAGRVRMFFRMLLSIRRARKILLAKKQERAAEMLQKLHRGAMGRERYRIVRQQRDREAERIRRQKEAEEALKLRLAQEKAEEERKEREEMELILKRRKAAEDAEEAERKASLLREQTPQRKNLITQLFGSTKANQSVNLERKKSQTAAFSDLDPPRRRIRPRRLLALLRRHLPLWDLVCLRLLLPPCRQRLITV
jgi:hypothetical protein